MSRYGIVPDVLDQELGVSTFAVYAALCIYADKNGLAWPGQKTLARQLVVHPDTVRRALKELNARGLISIESPKKKGRGYHNRYLILDKPKRYAPQAPLENERYAEGMHEQPERYAPGGQEHYQRTLEQEDIDLERNKKALDEVRKSLVGKLSL